MTSLHGGSGRIAGTTMSGPTTTQSTMSTGFTLPPPPALEIHDGNVVEKWKKFRLAWSNRAKQKVRASTVIGKDARDVYFTFDWDDK